MKNILKKYQWVENVREQLDSLDSEEKKEMFLKKSLPIYEMGGISGNLSTKEDGGAQAMPAKSREEKQFEMIEELYNDAKRSKKLSRIYGWGGILITIVASIITYLLTKC